MNDQHEGENMSDNPLKQLSNLGQSIWLDYIRRDLISSGELRHLIENDGLHGMTSNPSIFEKAISGSNDYDDDIHAMSAAGKNCKEIYEAISLQDVIHAANVFRPVYSATSVLDGYVSLEVNPHLAHDTAGDRTELLRRIAVRPWLWLAAPIYAFVVLMTAIKTRRAMKTRQPVAWERDLSSRTSLVSSSGRSA